MLRILTQADPETVFGLMEIYRESMAQLAARFETYQQMEEAYAAFLKEFMAQPNQLVLVEESDGAWVSGLRAVEAKPGQWYLEALETAPQARGEGWGKQILADTRQMLAQRGAWEVFSLISPRNAPSIAAHLACGFSATQREPANGWGEKAPGMVLYAWQREDAPCT